MVSIPNLGSVTFRRLNVPPYRLLDATIWSPAFNKTKSAVEIADAPDVVTTAPIPPSISASLFSKISFVGLFSLV